MKNHFPPLQGVLIFLFFPIFFIYLLQKKYILKNTRKKSDIISPFTRAFMELDFWLPELNLAFEFQVCSFSFYVLYQSKVLKKKGKKELPMQKRKILRQGFSFLLFHQVDRIFFILHINITYVIKELLSYQSSFWKHIYFMCHWKSLKYTLRKGQVFLDMGRRERKGN
jgi:hypothetical protein